MERYPPPLLCPDALRKLVGTAGKLLRKTIAFFVALLFCTAAAASPTAVLIPLNGAVGPASADFVVRALARAAEDHAQLAILEIDTPGGLDQSMRSIIKAILSSPIPVAAFIAPGGARAASAGTYIVYASHIAAMAPGTNLGAATPIRLSAGESPEPASPTSPASGASASASANAQSTETTKQVQDAAAYIRGLAQLRGRNVQWAERAVREAVSLSANEALAQNVIDLTALDVPDLLAKLNGRHIRTITGDHLLATSGAVVVSIQPDWRSRFLATITDPSVALILVTIGMYGLFFEFANPGIALPGVAGAISLMIGLFALQLLPVDFAGLGLILLGIAFLVAEMFLPTFGTLGFGGIVAFAMGALMLFHTDVPGYGIPVGARRRPDHRHRPVRVRRVKRRAAGAPTARGERRGSACLAASARCWKTWRRVTAAGLACTANAGVYLSRRLRHCSRAGSESACIGRHGLTLSVARLDEVKQGEK